MSETYTPDPTFFNDTYTIPDDGDDIDAASVNTALQALADSVAHVNEANDKFFTFADSGTTLIEADNVGYWGSYATLLNAIGTISTTQSIVVSGTFWVNANATVTNAEFRLAIKQDSTITPITGALAVIPSLGTTKTQITLQGSLKFASDTGPDLVVQVKSDGTNSIYVYAPCGGYGWIRVVDE